MKVKEGMAIMLLVWSCRMVCGTPLCQPGDFDSQVQQLLMSTMLTPQEIHNINGSFQDLEDDLRTRWGRVAIMLLVWSCHKVCGTPLCQPGDFDSQVQQLLMSTMLTPQEVHNITGSFHDLKDDLRTRWGSAEVFPYGSLPAGLGTKTSDVDLYARIPNYNETADAYMVMETAKLLNNIRQKYGDVQQYLNKKVPVLTYYDIPKQRDVDITFRSDAWHHTKLVSYFLQLDERHLPLTAVIKIWCKVHHLTGKPAMPNYAMYMLVIFYLQQKKMVPSVSAVQANLPPLIVNKWNSNFKEITYNVENNETLYELLGGFFKYYSEFNFKDNCVSPFVGRAIPRRDFENIDTVPEEFSLYKTNIKVGDRRPLPFDTALCIQDVFEHNSNTAIRAKEASALEFINHVKYAAKMYDELPCDQFLKSILVTDIPGVPKL